MMRTRDMEQSIFKSIDSGDVSKLCTLLDECDNIDYLVEGWTPLTFACDRGNVQMVEKLIIKIKQQEHQKRRRKMKIGSYVYTSVSLDSYNGNGETALSCAARAGHLSVCHKLLEEGAGINQTTQCVHQTPLHVAVENGHLNIVEYLINNGADFQMADNVSISPLYTAIKGRNFEIVQKLIEAGCDVNLGSQDHTPIFLAARLGLLDVVKTLCEAGCNKDFPNKYGVTPLHEAVLKGHVDILEYLIDSDCDVNKMNNNGVSALHMACQCGNLEAVRILMKGGACPRLKLPAGETALQIAVETNKYQIVEFFLLQGADILSQPYANKSLSCIAKVFDRGHKETAEILLKGCAKLPIPHYPGVTDMFCNSPHLMKMLFLSGIQTIPGVLIVPRLHPKHVDNKEISEWLANFHRNPRSLQSLCRIRIRRCLNNTVLHKAEHLPLPQSLRDFICLKHL